ncbi:MAG: hypothetical protein KGI28_08445 [Thaumarchaeota archaeon]|nr:hypothetical protein [Nitrososphaerota archaeon]
MGKIDVSVRKTLRVLEDQARKSISTGMVDSWNQYQIISVEKWEKLKKKKSSLAVLMRYLPEEYLDHPLLHYPGTESKDPKIDTWFSDWEKYLEEKKDAGLGKFRCAHCILHPDAARFDEGLHSIMTKGIDGKFPCKVVDIFQCPFEENEQLFHLKYMFDYIRDAISHAESVTHEMDKTHYAYPSRSHVEDFMNLHQSGKPNSFGRDTFLGEAEFTRVPIRNISDKFNILTDKKLLGIILDEYVIHLRKDTDYGSREYTIEKAETLSKIKSDILHYFSSIKSKISIGDVRDSRGRNLEDERAENKRIAELYEEQSQEDYNLRQNMNKKRNSLCMTCNEFANILCMECDKWVCTVHYNEHKATIHTKVE